MRFFNQIVYIQFISMFESNLSICFLQVVQLQLIWGLERQHLYKFSKFIRFIKQYIQIKHGMFLNFRCILIALWIWLPSDLYCYAPATRHGWSLCFTHVITSVCAADILFPLNNLSPLKQIICNLYTVSGTIKEYPILISNIFHFFPVFEL